MTEDGNIKGKATIWLTFKMSVNDFMGIRNLTRDLDEIVKVGDALQERGWQIDYATHDGYYTDFKATKETTLREARMDRLTCANSRVMDFEGEDGEEYGDDE